MYNHYFKALAHEDRRAIVRKLQTESPTTLDIGPDDSENRGVMLHHQHLPLLAEAGLVEWDREAQVVSKGPAFSDLETIGEAVEAVPTAEAD